jgi:cysteine desulfuration protein SufE
MPVEKVVLEATAPMSIEELIAEFEFLSDWEDRCDLLIDLGFELPKLAEADKTEANRVHGCQSNVWLVARLNEGVSPARVEFLANSDSMFVNGLIAILLAVYNDKTPEEILETNADDVFKQLELDRHLSSQRRNGLHGMVKRVREFAAHAIAQRNL